jgi:hypothetical protein
MSQIKENTLLRWRREIRSGEATNATMRKLVEYVRYCNETFGLTPSALMDAYYVAVVALEEKENA